MIGTKFARTSTLAGFVPAGKLRHSYRILLPLLALCLATVAWSQPSPGPRGNRGLRLTPGAVQQARPAADASAGAQYRFITIGVPGSANAQAYGINNAGLVSGFYEDASSGSVYHGFVWQDGAFQTVDYPGAVYTYLFAVNNRGLATGLYGDGTSEYALVYSVLGGTWTLLPNIPGYPENEGYGIDDAGFVVGNAYTTDFSASVAWMWDPATLSYQTLAVPGAAQYSTEPNAINDKGQVVGYFADASGVYHGFLEQGGTYSTYDAPGASATYPDGINKSGTIVGQWNDAAGAAQGFLLTSAGLFTTVDYPGPLVTAIEGINDHGDICGTYVEDPSGARRAYIAIRR